MLAINNAKYINSILIITTIIGLCSNIAAFILMIIKHYVGFGVYSNPIVCSSANASSTTHTYAYAKYVQSNIINGCDAGQVFGVIAGTVALVMLISFRMKLPRPKENKQQQQQLQWSNKFHYGLFVLYAVCIIGLLIPTGYFFAYIIELPDIRICSISIAVQWYIIELLSALAMIIYIFNIAYLFKISRQAVDQKKEQKKQEKKKEIKTQPKAVEKEVQQKQQKPQKEQKQQPEAVPFFKNDDTFHNQSFKQEPLQNHILNNSRNQQIKEPLLPQNNSRVRFSEDQYERLQQLRRLRREQEEKIWDLQRKKRMLEFESNQKPIEQNINRPYEEKPKVQSEKDKANGNQTIINIHLAGSQAGKQPVIQQPLKKQVIKEAVVKKPKKISKRNTKSRGTIYQESDRHYKRSKSKRYKQDQKERYQTNKGFKPQQFNPYSLRNTDYFDQKTFVQPKIQTLPPQKKKLTLSHLHSVQIAPSPQTASQKIKIQQQNQTIRSLTPPNGIQISKNEQSFFRKLLEESQVKQRKIPEFKTPKKQIKPKNTKQTSALKKSLDDYFQALNVSMMHMRSAYEQEYVSQKSNYSSVLSNKDFAGIPTESADRNRLNSILNKQKMGNNPKTLSLEQIQEKIQKKYKNIS